MGISANSVEHLTARQVTFPELNQGVGWLEGNLNINSVSFSCFYGVFTTLLTLLLKPNHYIGEKNIFTRDSGVNWILSNIYLLVKQLTPSFPLNFHKSVRNISPFLSKSLYITYITFIGYWNTWIFVRPSQNSRPGCY